MLNFKKNRRKKERKKNTPRIYLYKYIRKLSTHTLHVNWMRKKVVFFSFDSRSSFSFEEIDGRTERKKKETSCSKLKAVLVKIVSRTTYQSKKGKRICVLQVIKIQEKKENLKIKLLFSTKL